jgi:hypothetical protein
MAHYTPNSIKTFLQTNSIIPSPGISQLDLNVRRGDKSLPTTNGPHVRTTNYSAPAKADNTTNTAIFNPIHSFYTAGSTCAFCTAAILSQRLPLNDE